ncbi:phage tail protein [Psychrobacillus sp. BM2]|uniref:phage tail protein n=1 Tax=Psychrobacillus sp. BM2 TaxID=3400421 RepID=UPI003B01DF0E
MNLLDLIISVAVNDSDATDSLNQLNSRAEGVGSKFKSVGLGIAKFGAIVATGTVAAVGAVGAMAKPLVEAAASAKAMEAQFGSVFDGMVDESKTAMEAIAKETGMLPNRIKGTFTQIAAFAKTTGMNTADSLALTDRATRAAADSAAFYDKSIESAAESLQSFLKGNFENDAALGISATETTRNAAANELYGKSFKKLDESQKQLTLLKMVEDGNKLSGALGQAAKESDAFENQIGNLKQAWTDIKAKFGEPILEPAVKMITKLAATLDGFDVEPVIAKFEQFASFINVNVVSRVRDGFTVIKALYDSFMSVLNGTGEVGDILAKIGVSPEKAQLVQSFFQGVIDGFNTFKDGATSVIEGVKAYLTGYVDYVKGLFTGEGNVGESFVRIFNVIKAVAVPILEQVIEFIKTKLDELKKFWDENGKQISDAVKNVFSGIAKILEVLMPAILWIVEEVWGAIKNVINGALDIIMGLVKTFSGLFTGDFGKMWEGIEQIFGGALEAIWGLLQLGLLGRVFKLIKGFGKAAGDTVSDMVVVMSKKFDDISLKASIVFNAVKDAITKPINTAKDKVKEAVDFIKNLFDTLKITLPHIKTPSFKLKNWSNNPTDWLDQMPSIGISWNKNGGVFNEPTIFNTRNAGLQGVGEAGSEAILPLNKNTFEGIGTPIAEYVGKMIADLLGNGKDGVNITNHIYANNLDEASLARQQRKELEKMGLAW